MSRMQLVRTAPRRFRGLGQDDGSGDFSDYGTIDVTDNATVGPDVSAGITIPGVTAPDIGSPTYTGALGPGDYLPATPGTTVLAPVESQSALSSDLPGLILSGQLPPPAGSGLSSAQVAQIAAAGGSEADIQSILAGQTNPTTVLAALKAGGTALTALATLESTAPRATPVTTPLATAGTVIGTTSIANPLAVLQQATIIPGVPNWIVFAGGILGAAALASALGGKRR